MKELTIIGIALTLLIGLALWQQQHISIANAAPMVLTPIVIDDFNTGAFSLNGPSALINDLSASGAISGSRDVVFADSGGSTPTVMSLTPGNGYLNLALGDSPGNYNIGWGNNFIIGGTDLNLNASSYDRIVVTLSQAPSSGQMTVYFNRSVDTDGASASLPLNGAGNYTFLFSHPFLSPLNPSDIDGIAIIFDSGVTAGSTIRVAEVGIGEVPAILTVTNTNDSGGGSLRQAIAIAASGDTIVFDATVFSTPQIITLTSGELVINKSLTIDGPGASQLTVSGNDASRVFFIANGNTVTLDGLTVTGGNGTGAFASSTGGGIYNSTITLSLTNCTVSANSSDFNAGGISNFGGTLSLTSCTVSGNSASTFGGGIVNGGMMTLTNSTVTGNRADSDGDAFGSGGGITPVGTETLNNTIVAGNFVGAGSTPDDIIITFGTIDTANNSLIGDAATAGGITNGVNGNKVGFAVSDVLNTTLANNGGPPLTHALVCGSPAIDAGSNALALDASSNPLTIDQRGAGFPRTLDGNGDSTPVVDIGAFEALFNNPPTITGATIARQAGSPVSSSQIATVNDTESGAGGVTVTVTSANPSNGVTVSNIVNTNGNVTANVVADCTATNASFTLTVTDGNCATTATLNVTVTANTAPTLGVYSNTTLSPGSSTTVTPTSAPTDNSSINSSSVSAPGFTGSLSVSAAGVVSIGNAGPAGNYVVTVTLTDDCGLQTTRTFNLSVTTQFNFTGFFAPVDNLPTINVATAGSAIPLKFSLGGYQGLNIFAAGYPASSQISCEAGLPGDEIEETVTPGGSSLSYDATTDRYTYVWRTNRAWRGTCRIVVVRFSDGTEHFAKFRFR